MVFNKRFILHVMTKLTEKLSEKAITLLQDS